MMKYEDILSIFEDKVKCQGFLYKLKQFGENSDEIQFLKKMMSPMNLHKPPPGITQTTLLKNTFQFSQTLECFKTFRMVCKSWKLSVETSRFHLVDGYDFVRETIRGESQNIPKVYHLIAKSLKSFTSFSLPDHCFKLLVQNSSKLHSLKIKIEQYQSSHDTLICNLLKNSNTTLRELNIEKLILPIGVQFPNLTKIRVSFEDVTDNKEAFKNFQNQFKNLLNYAKNIKVIEIYNVQKTNENVYHYIATNYVEHCVIHFSRLINELDWYTLYNYLPIKIATISDIHVPNLLLQKFANSIEYLKISNLHFYEHEPPDHKNILSQLLNLKGVYLSNYYSGGYLQKHRENCLNSLGIPILDKDTFNSKEIELSNHIPWRFRFTSVTRQTETSLSF